MVQSMDNEVKLMLPNIRGSELGKQLNSGAKRSSINESKVSNAVTRDQSQNSKHN
jgi:hypothetical protein